MNDGEATLVHGRQPGIEADWLGELFEWISCADEYSIRSRDVVGRIPFSESYAARNGLDCRVPFAGVAMQFLQAAICREIPAVPTHPSLPGYEGQAVVNTHDIDFVPDKLMPNARRLVKNAGISLLSYRTPKLAVLQTAMAARLLMNHRNPFDQIDNISGGELQRGLGASYFFIAAQHHRRDANYSVQDAKIQAIMRSLVKAGFEIGVHGSYTSLDQQDGLELEYRTLRSLGLAVSGGRQHWLRFTVDRLIPALAKAGAAYDTSVGWPDQPGFRAGACFPFPPYDFEHERAATFLEFPLVFMDQQLLSSGRPISKWPKLVEGLLETSRRFGWGGISVLWHNTAFGSVQMPASVGQTFWDVADNRHRTGDTWLSGFELERTVRSRYLQAGLLE